MDQSRKLLPIQLAALAAVARYRRMTKAQRRAHTAAASVARDEYWKRRKLEIARRKLLEAADLVKALEAQQ